MRSLLLLFMITLPLTSAAIDVDDLNNGSYNAKMYNRILNATLFGEIHNWEIESNKKHYLEISAKMRKMTKIIFQELMFFDRFVQDCSFRPDNTTDPNTHYNKANVGRIVRILDNKDRVENYIENPFNHLNKESPNSIGLSTQAMVDFLLRPKLFKERTLKIFEKNPLNSEKQLRSSFPKFIGKAKIDQNIKNSQKDLAHFQKTKKEVTRLLNQQIKNLNNLKHFIKTNKSKLLSCKSKRSNLYNNQRTSRKGKPVH